MKDPQSGELHREIVKRLRSFIQKKRKRKLSESLVLILGVTLQPDGGDDAHPAVKELLNHLIKGGTLISYSDPYVPYLRLENTHLLSQGLFESFLRQQDCVVVLTPHRVYDWKYIVAHSEFVLDFAGAITFPSENVERVHFR
ncbi:MAG: UDP binding domain-containing protein [bacterium JZ-2024 1]